MDKLDAACADAGVEERLVKTALTPTHPTHVCHQGLLQPLVSHFCFVLPSFTKYLEYIFELNFLIMIKELVPRGRVNQLMNVEVF